MCTKCNHEGWIYYTKKVYENMPEMEYARKCECGKAGKQEFETRLEKSGLGDFFKEKTFENYITPVDNLVMIKDACVNYVNSYSQIQFNACNGLLLCGNVGSGKTHLACAVINRLMESGFQCEYFDYRENMTMLKQCVLNQEKYEKKMDKVKTVKILLVDDLFKGKITDSDVNIMYEIINARYQRKLATIITTEKDPEQLLDIDSAVGSRIIEMTRDNLINISKTGNYRLK